MWKVVLLIVVLSITQQCANADISGHCRYPSVGFSTISCNDSLQANSVCSFQCADHYTLIGSASATCTEQHPSDSIWVPSLPTCRADCPAYMVNLAKASCTNGRKEGSVCTSTCADGYTLVGEMSSTCKEKSGSGSDLVWDPPLPTCQADCPPPSINFGSADCSSDRQVTSICTSVCSSGYDMIGSASSTCTEQSGSTPVWSPPLPTCQEE